MDTTRQSTCLVVKVSKGAKIRNRYNQAPYLTQDTNGKVTNSQFKPITVYRYGFLFNCTMVGQASGLNGVPDVKL